MIVDRTHRSRWTLRSALDIGSVSLIRPELAKHGSKRLRLFRYRINDLNVHSCGEGTRKTRDYVDGKHELKVQGILTIFEEG